MSKYIIEVEDNAVDGLFKAKGFNTLVFDQDGLDKLQKYEESVEEKQSWPQIGDEFWNITASGQICNYFYERVEFDTKCEKLGNFFKSKEEAEFALERLKVLAEMRKFAEPFNTKFDNVKGHYYVYYDNANRKLEVDNVRAIRCGELYFESQERAKECIKAVGEDRIKKYYLGVE